jgi:hypothetical protein
MRTVGRLIIIVMLALRALSATAAPCDRNADEDELRRMHKTVLDAHLRSDVELLFRDAASDYSVANRGEISHPTGQELRARLGPYLEATRFEVYRDVVEPIVKVSADCALGWVIAQVEARGKQRTDNGKTELLEFVSAWIELYEKRDGRWLQVGNVSNFKPAE